MVARRPGVAGQEGEPAGGGGDQEPPAAEPALMTRWPAARADARRRDVRRGPAQDVVVRDLVQAHDAAAMRRRERARRRLGPEGHRFRGAHAAGPAALDDEQALRPSAQAPASGACQLVVRPMSLTQMAVMSRGSSGRRVNAMASRTWVNHNGPSRLARKICALGLDVLDQGHAAIVADIAGAGLARRRAGHLLRVVAGGEHKKDKQGAQRHISLLASSRGQPRERHQHPGRQGAERRRGVAGGAGVHPGEPGHQRVGEAGEQQREMRPSD